LDRRFLPFSGFLIKRQQMQSIDRYIFIAQEVGCHATATEMQRLRSGVSLYRKIRTRWGSMAAFREALGISFSKGADVFCHR
jgi:hypothetical protein